MWACMVGCACFFVVFMIMDTRREIREIGEQVSMLQQDFISEINDRYGDLRGKE
jgi:type III secretory pathway component EscU